MVRQGQGEAEFPQKQLETAFLHSLRLMDQNREYLQMHLAPAADSRAAQALDDMAVESARLERTFREVMELSAPEQPLHKLPLDLCQLVSQMARMGEEIKAQCGTTLRVDCGGLTQCLVWGDRAMAEQICFHLLSNALHAAARYCRQLGWELALLPRSPQGARAELKLPLPARPVPIEATVEFRSSADRTPTALQHQLRRELYLLTRKTPLSD